jgi:hypothetical protein
MTDRRYPLSSKLGVLRHSTGGKPCISNRGPAPGTRLDDVPKVSAAHAALFQELSRPCVVREVSASAEWKGNVSYDPQANRQTGAR